MLKGAIFDMDGVVINNHHFHFKAWMEFSRRHRFEINEKIYREFYNGKTNDDLFQMIFGKLTAQEIENYAQEKEGLYQDFYKDHMVPHTGLVEFLRLLQEKRIGIALGTSAPTRNVDFTLDRLGLRHYFDVIVDGSQVERGKPDPEVYCLCAKKLNLEPKDCVVFEDSLAGLESGKRAGCQVVGLATSHEAHELLPKTDKIIPDFTEAQQLLGL